MILDASAFIVALGDEGVAASFAGEDLIAPDLIVPETLNALWKLARAGGDVPQRSIVFALLDDVAIVASRPFAVRAAELAETLDHPVYDCLYLALAEARGDVLATCDARFTRKIGRRALRKHIRLLGVGAPR